jgi:hypothetical protein
MSFGTRRRPMVPSRVVASRKSTLTPGGQKDGQVSWTRMGRDCGVLGLTASEWGLVPSKAGMRLPPYQPVHQVTNSLKPM